MGFLKFLDPLISWLTTVFSPIQTFRRTTVLLISILTLPFSSTLYRVHIHSHSTSSLSFAFACAFSTHLRLSLSFHARNFCKFMLCRPDELMIVLSGVCAALSSKPSLEIYSSFHPVGASCAVFPRLLGSAPRTENHSVPEMFHDSRHSSRVSGSSWSGRGSMNPCLLRVLKLS